MFEIQPEKIRIEAEQLSQYRATLSGLADRAQSVVDDGSINTASYYSISEVLDAVSSLIRDRGTDCEELGTSLRTITANYENTENIVAGRIRGETEIGPMGFGGGKGGGFRGSEDGDRSGQNDAWAEFLENIDKIGNLLDGWVSGDKKEPSSEYGVFSDLVDFITSGKKFSNSNENPFTSYTDWLKFFYSGLKFDKSAVRLIEKYIYKNPNSKFMDNFGPLMAGIKIIQELTKDYGENGGFNTGFFKDSNGFWGAVGKIAGDVSGKRIISNIENLNKTQLGDLDKYKLKYKNSTETVGPIMALINMAVYGVADGAEKIQEGLTWQSGADLLKGTGLTGLNSLVSTWTLGTVNLDVDKELNNFKEAEDFAKDIINGWEAPTGVKVVAGVAASVPVAAWGVTKSLFDFGVDIGLGIRGFFGF